jgi:hypothetical protein
MKPGNIIALCGLVVGLTGAAIGAVWAGGIWVSDVEHNIQLAQLAVEQHEERIQQQESVQQDVKAAVRGIERILEKQQKQKADMERLQKCFDMDISPEECPK